MKDNFFRSCHFLTIVPLFHLYIRCTADCGWITGHSYVTYGPLLNGATVLVFEGVITENFIVDVFLLNYTMSTLLFIF
jgi:hypothetical protein